MIQSNSYGHFQTEASPRSTYWRTITIIIATESTVFDQHHHHHHHHHKHRHHQHEQHHHHRERSHKYFNSLLHFVHNQFHFDPCRRNQWSAQQQHRHYHQDHRLHHHLDVHSNSLYSRIIANTIAQVCVMVVCISNMACIRDSLNPYFCSARTQRSEI